MLSVIRVSREASQLEDIETEDVEETSNNTAVVRVIVLDHQGRHVVKATSGVSGK